MDKHILAYLGDKKARMAVPLTCGVGFPDGGCANEAKDDCWDHKDEWPLDMWAAGFLKLAEDLGERSMDCSWKSWLGAWGGLAVGRAALPIAVARDNERPEGYGAGWVIGQGARDVQHQSWSQVLEATAAWCECPCKIHQDQWNIETRGWVPGDEPWLPTEFRLNRARYRIEQYTSATEFLDVHEVLRTAWLKAL